MIGLPPINSGLPVENNLASWSGPWGNWMSAAWLIINAVSLSGTTDKRPVDNVYVGQMYFDTTLGLPIWAKTLGSPISWVKADGTAA